MNIFFLDRHPIACAQAHCDKHVVKMILETAQLLSTAQFFNSTWTPEMYKPTHVNHPCALWVRYSAWNYIWAYDLLNALLDEYSHRYQKVHATGRVAKILSEAAGSHQQPWKDPPLAMPDEFKDLNGDTVRSYRQYYRQGKRHLLTYTRRDPPSWLSTERQNPK